MVSNWQQFLAVACDESGSGKICTGPVSFGSTVEVQLHITRIMADNPLVAAERPCAPGERLLLPARPAPFRATSMFGRHFRPHADRSTIAEDTPLLEKSPLPYTKIGTSIGCMLSDSIVILPSPMATPLQVVKKHDVDKSGMPLKISGNGVFGLR